MKFIVCATLVGFAASALSQDLPVHQHELSLFFGKSIIMIGSSDVRFGGGISYAYAKTEPRIENRFLNGQLVLEGYYDNTVGNGRHSPAWDSDAVGFLYYGRWMPRLTQPGTRPYFDLGWGFQYADRPTRDLPSEINSTPFADLGIAIPWQTRQILAGIRYLHISNAGFVKPNRGQNQLFLMASLSF